MPMPACDLAAWLHVVALALGERGDKHLGRQVVGGPVAGPPGQVLVNLAEVTLEDRGEPRGLGPRLLDHRSVGIRRAGALGGQGKGHLLRSVTRSP
jgi:hypothetical protein